MHGYACVCVEGGMKPEMHKKVHYGFFSNALLSVGKVNDL